MAYDEQATMMADGRPSARLMVRQGTQAGVTFPLTSDQVIIGREEGVDIVIQDPEVSRRHAQITWQADAFVIEDLGSTNGVFINGIEISEAYSLRNGDAIRLGQTTLLYQVSGATVPSVSPPAAAYVDDVRDEPFGQEAVPQRDNRRRWLFIGCGCLLALCACLALTLTLAVTSGYLDPDALFAF